MSGDDERDDMRAQNMRAQNMRAQNMRANDRRANDMRADDAFHHVPVMLPEVLEWLRVVPDGVMVDATLGGAGHTQAILAAEPRLRIIGLDRDPVAIDVASTRLAQSIVDGRVALRLCRYDAIGDAVADVARLNPDWFLQGAPFLSAVLFDLGVSSAQFDIAERGFSYRSDAPLDMRMNQQQGRTAADICNEYSERELATILDRYGDERFARRIAKAIIAHRPILTTLQLAAVVTDAIPAATRRTGGHPAKRTFQALRLEVNEELPVLERALDAALDLLSPGGRCIVLSYHSGEDRIVKDRFRLAETGGCSCPSGLPCVCGALPRGRMVRRGVTRPQAAEIAANPRAASCVARVFERAGAAVEISATAAPERARNTSSKRSRTTK